MIYPKENIAIKIVYMRNGIKRKTRGMFYMNGTNPTFAAYGFQIENVIGWETI